MADVQVTSAKLEDGVLTVTGLGFTKTTTQLMVNGVEVSFEAGPDFDGTELIVRDGLPPEGTGKVEVWAFKSGIESDHVEATPDPQTGDTGSAENPSQTTSTEAEAGPTEGKDQSSSEDQGGSREPYDPGGDAHSQGYKTATANQTPGDLTEDDLKTTADVNPAQLNQADIQRDRATSVPQPNRTPLKEGEHLPGEDFRTQVENTAAGDLNWDPRKPYPKGNPPDHRESFHRIHGYYPPEEGGGAQDEQASQMDADPKT